MTDHSSRPRFSPGRTPTRTERRIIGLRVTRRWGPHRIAYHWGCRVPRSGGCWPGTGCREPPSRGGHLVLVVGTTPGALLVHNPSGLPGESQEYAEVPTAAFGRFFAGRGVAFPACGATAAP